MSGAVVVGVDGSRSAGSALAWAADDAARRKLPLRIVHVREPWRAEHPLTAASPQTTRTEQWTHLLQEAADQARSQVLGLDVSTALVTGAVVERLVSESETADTVVLGSRGRGGFTGLVLGSVGLGLAGRAHCPVVYVRRPAGEGGEIVVGYDGSADSESALEYAMAQASARGARARVVHGRQLAPLATEPASAGAIPVGDFRQLLVAWREKYPDVEVTESVVRGHPVPVLVEASLTAELVVVGSRGVGGFASAVLGSVSHGVLHRARCPVAVVRAPWRRA
ncbi:universal stress protein [Nonomuraea sp. NPDC005983]|uniref:universal stress protein n=1 Tax=Nonomuraea sp. NPDC005983 TaxID=3155595 RepID=UPI0033A84C98